VTTRWIAPAIAFLAAAAPARGEESTSPPYLADRGPGIPTSLFGTYVEPGQWLVYPFYEYTRTPKYEYHPSELGFTGSTDFLGKTFEHEALLFVSYGLSDRLAFEVEGALYSKVRFEKAPEDPSDVPPVIEESGFGDLDMQLRWRWREETEKRSELYSFFELTPPLQSNKTFLGTQDWEGALGFGYIRGHTWGTLNGRIAVAYDGEDSRVELGEYAIEYLKRVSERWRFVATIEGESEEVALIGEAQWFFSPRAVLKLNCGFGLTTQAPDIAPEVGVLFHF
jgi:hypothetical protein